MNIKQVIKEAVVLAVIATAAALLINGVSPEGLPLARPPETTLTGSVSLDTIIDVAAAESLLKNHSAVFVDARSRDNYRQGHIPGAVSLPAYGAADDQDSFFLAFMEQYPSDATIVVYCSGEHCSDSHVLAEELVEAGYTTVRVFAGGMDAWREKGLAVERNNEP